MRKQFHVLYRASMCLQIIPLEKIAAGINETLLNFFDKNVDYV